VTALRQLPVALSPTPFQVPAVALAFLATALHIRAEYRGPRWMVYLCKPLSTMTLLLLAVFSATAHGLRYQAAIAVGLGCSLLGDILLMLPRDRFVAGLASFLAAHLAYLAAFTSGVSAVSAPALLLPLLAAAVPLLRLLWPELGALRMPVLLYSAAILLMVWRAWGREWTLPGAAAALAGAGATLFMVSDALLALNRFHRPFASAQALIMSTYVAAQALIALSVGTA
jgi:uncharacterized membrane protein YhhN